MLVLSFTGMTWGYFAVSDLLGNKLETPLWGFYSAT